MKFHKFKSFILLTFTAIIFTACADEKTSGGDTPPPIIPIISSTNCTMTGTDTKCTNILVDHDIDFINSHKATITSLDLTAIPNMITQKQLDHITSTDFPLLDNLSISNNTQLTSLNLVKFPALTKLSAMFVSNITGFNDIKNNLTTIEVSKESGIPLADITGIKDKTKVTKLELHDYIDTTLDISGFTNLTSLNVQNLAKLEALDLSKLTKLTKLNVQHLAKLEALDLSAQTNLTYLMVTLLGSVPTLELAKLTNLTYLEIGDLNQLNTLDLSKLTNLTSLKVQGLYKQIGRASCRERV